MAREKPGSCAQMVGWCRVLREFVHYRSPSLSRAGAGESLRTRHAADAYERARHFILTATDASAPTKAELRVYKADDVPEEPLPPPAQAARERFGIASRNALSAEIYWEWSSEPGAGHPETVARFVAFTSEHEPLPRIWLSPTLRGHDAPRRPQVETRLTWEFKLTDDGGDVLPDQDDSLYLPGWNGPSRLILNLGSNRFSLVLKLPLAGAALESCVARIEEALGHQLDRRCFRRVRLNADETGYVERTL